MADIPKRIGATGAAVIRLADRSPKHIRADVLAPDPFPIDSDRYERYRDFKFVAQGSFGTTKKAVDEEGRTVLVKEFNFRVAEGMSPSEKWAVFDSFEAETKAIKNLDHPLIPKYIDSFARQVDGEIRFYLVTEYINGPNLEQRLADATPFTEAEAKGIAKDVLGILKYLQGFSPPLLHRDITPKNIVLDQEGRAHLVDFGSVALKTCTTIKGTICGTPGYAAPEQLLVGKASPASDVYGLGASLIRILTRQEMADLADEQGRINFRKYINVSPAFIALLEKMIEPKASDRFANAEDTLKAIDDLENGKSMVRAADMAQGRPSSIFRRKSPEEKELDAKAKEVARSIRTAFRLVEEGKLSAYELAVHLQSADVQIDPDCKFIRVRDVKLYSLKDAFLWSFGSGVTGTALAAFLLGSMPLGAACGAMISIAVAIGWEIGERRRLSEAVRKILAENSERSEALREFGAALERSIKERKELQEAEKGERSLRASKAEEVPLGFRVERLGRLARPQDPFPGTDGSWDHDPFLAALQGPELSPAEAERFNAARPRRSTLEKIRGALPAFRKKG